MLEERHINVVAEETVSPLFGPYIIWLVGVG